MSAGYDIWNNHRCVGRERSRSVYTTEDLYEDIVVWWITQFDNTLDPNDYLVKLFCDGEEEELTIKEILDIKGV